MLAERWFVLIDTYRCLMQNKGIVGLAPAVKVVLIDTYRCLMQNTKPVTNRMVKSLNRYISLLNAEPCHIENLSQSDRQRGQIRDVDFRHHSTG